MITSIQEITGISFKNEILFSLQVHKQKLVRLVGTLNLTL